MDKVLNWLRELFIKTVLQKNLNIISKELLFLKDEENLFYDLFGSFVGKYFGF